MTKLRIVSICALVACGSLFFASRANRAQVLPGKSYQMVSLETTRRGDEIRPLELRTRLVKATGEWKEESVSLRKESEGRKRVVFNTPEGQYLQGPQSPELQLVDGFVRGVPPSADALRKHREFVRTDSLLGFTTYVLRSGWVEQHYAPEVGSIPVKVVMDLGNGSQQIIEAIQIDFRPVTDEELARPSLPVKLGILQSKIEQAERRGQKDFAESLRRIMRESAAK